MEKEWTSFFFCSGYIHLKFTWFIFDNSCFLFDSSKFLFFLRLKRKNKNLLESVNCPDLDSIEHLRREFKKKVNENTLSTNEGLLIAIQEIWNNFDKECFFKL